MMWKIGFFVLCATVFANASPQKAVAVLKNPTLNINGVINFEQSEHGIIIYGNITGLKPGPHGFHVHEKGDISDPKCLSTGGHFNPFNKHHGAPEDEDRHVGDLGNIIANEDGVAIISIKDNLVSLNAPNCVIGRGVVVHENADDLGKGGFSDSLTTGHAGGRLACGVIGYA